MDNTEKRIRETIDSMPDKDLYSIGDAQVASDEAKEMAINLQHKAEEHNIHPENERKGHQ